MKSVSREEARAFLEELTDLSIKHGIEIAGCGCCGSPFLSTLSHDVPCSYNVSEGGDYLSFYPVKEGAS